MKTTTFRGTTEECLKDFSSKMPPATTRAGVLAREPVWKFCRVARRTANDWLSSSEGPKAKGIPLFKLQCFLETQGYQVDELVTLTPMAGLAKRLVGYSLVEVAELQRVLQYRNAYDTMRVVHGQQIPLEPARSRLMEFMQSCEPKLAVVMKTSLPRSSPKPVTSDTARRANGSLSANPVSLDRHKFIEGTAAQLRGLLANVAMLDSDECTEEDRALLRELAGARVVFTLSNHFNRLCSEDSRRGMPLVPRSVIERR